MRTLTELAEASGVKGLERADFDWLHQLMADWQVLADLAASDLVLWLRTESGGFVAASLCRPGTSSTIHLDDIVGLSASANRAETLERAFTSGKIIEGGEVQWAGSYSLSGACVPIARDGKTIAVMSREGNFSAFANSATHASWTMAAADSLCTMAARGEYPYASAPSMSRSGVPRVNDGAMMLDVDGRVLQATPNAVSCMRRIGLSSDFEGTILAESLSEIASSRNVVDETLPLVALGRASWRAEVEGHGSTIALRALPLLERGHRVGAVLLTRDITETVRREQELMTKDATIREIHHRVKNNLQTVSALLRMQSRRSMSGEAKQALYEAGRRVEAIATVHEALSQNVDEVVPFDEVAIPILRMAAGVASTGESVEVEVDGEFGTVPADAAAALATVLTELVTNSVEHGFAHQGGTITISADRDGDRLRVDVADDGAGIDLDLIDGGLGTQIVKMMVKGELRGTIAWRSPEEGGTVVTLDLDVSNE